MTIIRQGSLFGLQELYDLEPTQRFEAIFSTIDINQIFAVVTKKSRFGRPIKLNYAAMIYSLDAIITERIPFTKDLVRRLRNDMKFRLDCGFLVSDSIPSEAAFSRMVTVISESNVLESVPETLLLQAITEGLSMMIRLLQTLAILNLVIKHPKKRRNQTTSPKNEVAKQKLNENNG
jgi:transposase